MHHGDNSSVFETPKLVKALGHLTTPISTLRFNHDAQILAMASKDKKDAMRLVGHYFLAFGFFFLCFITSRFPLPSSANRTTFTNLRLASGQRLTTRFPSFLAEPPYFPSLHRFYFPEDIVRLFYFIL